MIHSSALKKLMLSFALPFTLAASNSSGNSESILAKTQHAAKKGFSFLNNFWWQEEINQYLKADLAHLLSVRPNNSPEPGNTLRWSELFTSERTTQNSESKQHLVWGTATGLLVATVIDRLMKSALENASSERHGLSQAIKHALLSFYGSLLFARSKEEFRDKRLWTTIGTIVGLDACRALLFTNKHHAMDEAATESERMRINELDYLRLKRCLRDSLTTFIALVAGGTAGYLAQSQPSPKET